MRGRCLAWAGVMGLCAACDDIVVPLNATPGLDAQTRQAETRGPADGMGEGTQPATPCGADADCKPRAGCLVATCSAAKLCQEAPKAGFCWAAGQCYADGQEEPGNRCHLCQTAFTQTALVNRVCPAGQSCDPAAACVGGDGSEGTLDVADATPGDATKPGDATPDLTKDAPADAPAPPEAGAGPDVLLDAGPEGWSDIGPDVPTPAGACDPFGAPTCPSGQYCNPLSEWMLSGQKWGACADDPQGTLGEGQACDEDEGKLCQTGLYCFRTFFSAEKRCRIWCDPAQTPGAGKPGACTSGEYCLQAPVATKDGGAWQMSPFGLCHQSCQPWSNNAECQNGQWCAPDPFNEGKGTCEGPPVGTCEGEGVGSCPIGWTCAEGCQEICVPGAQAGQPGATCGSSEICTPKLGFFDVDILVTNLGYCAGTCDVDTGVGCKDTQLQCVMAEIAPEYPADFCVEPPLPGVWPMGELELCGSVASGDLYLEEGTYCGPHAKCAIRKGLGDWYTPRCYDFCRASVAPIGKAQHPDCRRATAVCQALPDTPTLGICGGDACKTPNECPPAANPPKCGQLGCQGGACGYDLAGCCDKDAECPLPPEITCGYAYCDQGSCESYAYEPGTCCTTTADCMPQAWWWPCSAPVCQDGYCNQDQSACACTWDGECVYPNCAETWCAGGTCVAPNPGACSCSSDAECPGDPSDPCQTPQCTGQKVCTYVTTAGCK